MRSRVFLTGEWRYLAMLNYRVDPTLLEPLVPRGTSLDRWQGATYLNRVDVRDLTLPGDLMKLFTQVTKARQEGLAALERARGETAALRNLANAGRLVSDNPALMQLRLLQVVGEQSGNTVVLGMPPSATTVPIGSARPRIEGAEPDVSES